VKRPIPCVGTMLLIVVLVAPVMAQLPANVSAQWTIDLASLGYENPASGREKAFDLSQSNDGIAFTDSGRLVAYFVTKADVSQLSSRTDVKAGTAFRLRAVFADVSSQKIVSTKDWPARAFPTWLMPTAGGRFIIRTGDCLQIYSADFALLKERTLGTGGTSFESWHLKASPSGRVLWLDHEDGKSHLEVVDAESLEPVSRWEQDMLGGWFSVSDNNITTRPARRPGQILIRSISSPWHVLYDSGSGSAVGEPSLVSDNAIMAGTADEVLLLSTGGEIVMRDAVPKKEHLEQIVASRDGKLAAATLVRIKGGGLFDTAMHQSGATVVTYDLERRRAISTIAINTRSSSPYHVALSSDGSLVAVMSGSIVTVYPTKGSPVTATKPKP
jgi:hypothetical protein